METEKKQTTITINSIEELSTKERESLIQTYQEAFSQPPYNERFTIDEVVTTFDAITRMNGDIIILKDKDSNVQSFGAGFMRDDDVYWIEELATKPDLQCRGYGSAMLEQLESVAMARKAKCMELRTTEGNQKALNLYYKSGYKDTGERVLVTQQRTDGQPGTDIRMYLRKPIVQEYSRNEKLRSLVIAYPSGNPTALVLDQRYENRAQELNDKLMQQFPEVEQGGFLLPTTHPDCIGRIRMFGGEFCGNAARSAIWIFTQGKPGQGYLEFEVGETSQALAYTVFTDGQVEVEMPLPKENVIEERKDGILVSLDGIKQLVVEYNPGEGLSPEELKSRAKEILRKNNLLTEPAAGVMFYSKELGVIEPVVWVRDIETYFYETACGSGTCAVGVAENYLSDKSVVIPVKQPSGEIITVSVVRDSLSEFKAKIKGAVRELYRGNIALGGQKNE